MAVVIERRSRRLMVLSGCRGANTETRSERTVRVEPIRGEGGWAVADGRRGRAAERPRSSAAQAGQAGQEAARSSRPRSRPNIPEAGPPVLRLSQIHHSHGRRSVPALVRGPGRVLVQPGLGPGSELLDPAEANEPGGGSQPGSRSDRLRRTYRARSSVTIESRWASKDANRPGWLASEGSVLWWAGRSLKI